jgi:predicted dehydrogenase
VTKKALLAGKHSYCEKPMATKFENGQELFNLAKENNLYLGNAPDTFLGAGVQKSRELIDSGIIGEIKLGNAIFAFPGVQSYHPDPEPWFQKNGGGPVIDMGPYYLTTLVNLLGPAKEVQGREFTGYQDRVIGIGPKKGQKIKIDSPTTYLATIQFHSDALIQLTLSFDVVDHQRNHIEFYGTKGSIIVTDPNMFGGSSFVCTNTGEKWKEYKTENMHLGKINIRNHSGRLNESPTNANYRGIGLSEMLFCIENNKNHRCNGELALHVLDIIESTMLAAISKTPRKMRTACKKPEFFPEEEVSKLLL